MTRESLRAEPGGASTIAAFLCCLFYVGTVPEAQMLEAAEDLPEQAAEAFMTTAQQMMARARQEGRQEGLNAGEHAALAAVVLRQAWLRFGEIPPETAARIDAASKTELEHFVEVILTAERLDDLFAASPLGQTPSRFDPRGTVSDPLSRSEPVEPMRRSTRTSKVPGPWVAMALGLLACARDPAESGTAAVDATPTDARSSAAPDAMAPDAARSPDAAQRLDAAPPPDAAPAATTDTAPTPDAAPPPDAAPAPDAAIEPPGCFPLPADAPLDLDTAPGISENGRLVTNRGQPAPGPLSICPGESDHFRLMLDAGDALSVLATAWNPMGVVVIELLDAGGEVIGLAGRLGLDGLGAITEARAAELHDAPAGPVTIRVRSVDGGFARNYFLGVMRSPVPVCSPRDGYDAAPARNDTWETATPLAPFDPFRERYIAETPTLCDTDHVDRDWYVFHAPAPGTRLCFVAQAEDVATPVALRVMVPDTPPLACAADADCPEQCVANRCRHARVGGEDTDRVHMVEVPRAEAVVGDYYVAVDRTVADLAGIERNYRFTGTVAAPSNLCHADPRLQDDGPAMWVQLGDGDAAHCETWTCDGDPSVRRYGMSVPPGSGDRTVVVTYDAVNDGWIDALLRATHPETLQDADYGAQGQAAPHGMCFNVRGGVDGRFEMLQLALRPVANPADQRDHQVDYAVRVVHRAGRCAEFVPDAPPAIEVQLP